MKKFWHISARGGHDGGGKGGGGEGAATFTAATTGAAVTEMDTPMDEPISEVKDGEETAVETEDVVTAPDGAITTLASLPVMVTDRIIEAVRPEMEARRPARTAASACAIDENERRR